MGRKRVWNRKLRTLDQSIVKNILSTTQNKEYAICKMEFPIRKKEIGNFKVVSL